MLASCNFKVGQYVKVRGTSRKVQIEDIYTDLEDVEWTHNRPYFIVVKHPDGRLLLAHMGQLRVR